MISVAFKIECRDYLTELRHSFCCTYPSRTKVPSVARKLYTCYAFRWTIILNLSPQPYGKVAIELVYVTRNTKSVAKFHQWFNPFQ